MFSTETQSVLYWFEELSKIPRKSKNEGGVREWLASIAKSKGWQSKVDSVGNILIEVPASPGRESAPRLVLQGHMDMVCEKTPDSNHDFTKDPIKLVYDKVDWLHADKTTLGADNGIAIALVLALLNDKKTAHPPLELLFTVDEETGLTGALNLEPGWIKGKILLNIDSEDEGVFTVGCAGGRTSNISLPFKRETIPEGFKPFSIALSGLIGGHSGVNINSQRGNGLKLLFRALNEISKVIDLRLFDVSGGTAHNAIPRSGLARVFLKATDEITAKKILSELEKTIQHELSSVDPNISLSLTSLNLSEAMSMSKESTLQMINFMVSMPHGVSSMSMGVKDLVETSNNVAKVWVESDVLHVVSSQRSTVMSRLDEICDRIESLVYLAGGTVETGDGYPSWEPNWNSPLLAKCKSIYSQKFGKEPIVEVIHAGLECGIIGSKYPGMDMISFGPTIRNPHTPSEELHLPDIDKIWTLMVGLFDQL